MTVADSPATSQLARLIELVSPRTGLIRHLTRRPFSAEDPALPVIYDAELAHFDFRYGDSHERGACGKGFSEETAMLAAIGECVERYCASHPRAKQVKRACLGELSGEMIPPSEFVPFSASQYARPDFPFKAWDPAKTIPWLAANELGREEPVWLPAQLLYLNFSGTEPQDFLAPPSSNGFAAGPDLAAAIRAALCETLERDAFIISWLNRLPAREIIDARQYGVEAMIRQSYARMGIELRLFLLATDMPAACVLALAVNSPGKRPAAVVGLACDLDPGVAVRKALFEICQVHGPFRRKCAESAGKPFSHYSDVENLSDHAAYFFNPEAFKEFDFLIGADNPVNFEDIPAYGGPSIDADIARIAEAVNAAGSRVFWRDITTPDLYDYPIRVARVLITDFQPIHFGYGRERLGGHRLYRLPMKLGLRSEAAEATQLNLCPHPLA